MASKKSPIKQQQRRVEPLPTASILGFFTAEDEEAMRTSSSEMEREAYKCTELIRDEIVVSTNNTEYWDEDKKDNILVPAVKLRRQNRLSNFRNRLLRERLSIAQSKVESKYLFLENIMSEIAHLKKTIDVCLEFQSSDANIELSPLDEFLKTAPESINFDEAGSEHRLHIARLNFELMERKSILANLNEMEGRKSVLLSDIKGKEQRLLQIKPRICQLMDAAKPLLESLSLKALKFSALEMQNKVKFLPIELSLLHTNACVYKELLDDKSLNIIIEGDVSAAQNFSNFEEIDDANNQTENDIEISDFRPKHRDHKIHRTRSTDEQIKESLSKKRAKLFTIHPMNLILEITELKLLLKFSLNDSLKTIGLICSFNSIQDITREYITSIFNTQWIFDDLFDGDIGSSCPSFQGEAMLKILDIKVEEFFPISGKQYKFVQQLCLSADQTASNVDAKLTQHFNYFVEVFSRIKKRMKARFSLAKSLKQIQDHISSQALQNFWSDIPQLCSFFPSKILCKLSKFIFILPEEFLSLTSSRRHSRIIKHFAQSIKSGTQYQAVLSRDTFSLSAFIHIPISYPEFPPVFVLVNSDHCSVEYSLAVLELERYVNIEVVDLMCDNDELRDNILLLQLGMLLTRLDVVLELTSKKLGTNEFAFEHNYVQPFSGRKRGFPLKFNSVLNSFDFD